jgi:tetratricopeptide (TPR) repeat protein
MLGKLIRNLLGTRRRTSAAAGNQTLSVASALDAALSHQKNGRFAEAERIYREILRTNPDNHDVLHLLGNAVREQGRLDEAIELLQRLTARAPRMVEAHFDLGEAFRSRGDMARAARHYQRAIDLDPILAAAHRNFWSALCTLPQLDVSIAACRREVELRPDLAKAHYILGIVLSLDGRDVKEVARSFERALELQPDNAELRHAHALALLACGDLERGWKDYESRFDAGRGEARVPRPALPQPEWQGEDLTGKTILVWGEQGIGDQIWFAGLMPELIERARRCTVLCPPKLVPLFTRSFPDAHVTAQINATNLADVFDVQVAAGSVARWLRPTLDSFPNRPSYLVADPQRVAYWRGRFAEIGGGLKVGFCWRSSDLKGERALYYTSLSQWGPIFAVPGVHFVNLQYDECLGELDQARREFGVTLHHFPEVGMFDDLDETAALMKALDLVISAPTAVIAQAAALGLPCWQMCRGVDCWALGAEHNPWYPTMEYFPCKWAQPWSVIIDQIVSELRRISRAHG